MFIIQATVVFVTDISFPPSLMYVGKLQLPERSSPVSVSSNVWHLSIGEGNRGKGIRERE
jgi:hypothetical protein